MNNRGSELWATNIIYFSIVSIVRGWFFLAVIPLVTANSSIALKCFTLVHVQHFQRIHSINAYFCESGENRMQELKWTRDSGKSYVHICSSQQETVRSSWLRRASILTTLYYSTNALNCINCMVSKNTLRI